MAAVGDLARGRTVENLRVSPQWGREAIPNPATAVIGSLPSPAGAKSLEYLAMDISADYIAPVQRRRARRLLVLRVRGAGGQGVAEPHPRRGVRPGLRRPPLLRHERAPAPARRTSSRSSAALPRELRRLAAGAPPPSSRPARASPPGCSTARDSRTSSRSSAALPRELRRLAAGAPPPSSRPARASPAGCSTAREAARDEELRRPRSLRTRSSRHSASVCCPFLV
jgi:hypothetical protein